MNGDCSEDAGLLVPTRSVGTRPTVASAHGVKFLPGVFTTVSVNVMNATAVVVEGRVQPDGRLEVTQKVELPAGPVQVTVRPAPEPVQPDRFWSMMESIWADLRSSGRPVPTRGIDAGSRPCAAKRKRSYG